MYSYPYKLTKAIAAQIDPHKKQKLDDVEAKRIHQTLTLMQKDNPVKDTEIPVPLSDLGNSIHDEQGQVFRRTGPTLLKLMEALPFDVYIQRSPKRFTRIFPKESAFDREQFKKYEEKGEYAVYLREEDMPLYFRKSNNLMNIALRSSQTPRKIKVEIVRDLFNMSLKQLMNQSQVNPTMIHETIQVTEHVVNYLSKDAMALAMLIHSFKQDDILCRHAVSASTLAILLASQTEFNRKDDLMTVGLAGLFHDIGLLQLPKEIREKVPEAMSQGELDLYRRHPNMSVSLLEKCGFKNSDVLKTILEHHERMDGQGFPTHLFGKDLGHHSRILSIVDYFSDQSIAYPSRPAVHPIRLLDEMNGMKGTFDPHLLFKFTFLFFPTDL